MATKSTRPSRSNGRPPGRRGRGGIGPPAGARTGGTGSGTSHTGGDTSCCPMVAAVRSVKRRKFRLARRYAAWSVRLIAARVS